MSFRLVPKSVIFKNLERRNGLILRYFTKSGSFRAHCIKLVDKAITINNWRLLCLVVNVCRGTAILDFKNVKVLTVEKVKKVEVHQRGKFPRNRTADEICEFQCYASLAWKCLFTPLFGVFGGTFLPNGVTHHPYPKRTILGLNHVIWAIIREYFPIDFWMGITRVLHKYFHWFNITGTPEMGLGVINMVGVNISNLSSL